MMKNSLALKGGGVSHKHRCSWSQDPSRFALEAQTDLPFSREAREPAVAGSPQAMNSGTMGISASWFQQSGRETRPL